MVTVIFGDFEWDDEKAEANRGKHGVSFEEAASIFLDVHYLLTADRDMKIGSSRSDSRSSPGCSSWCTSSAASAYASSARGARPGRRP